MRTIKEAVNTDSSTYFSKGLGHPNTEGNKEKIKSLFSKINENKIEPSLERFSNLVGHRANFNQKLGAHPNFSNLKNTGKTEEHYIISAFIDIKGSTNLFKKFDKETVFIITNTILKAGIHTMLIFNGYVHRLQGDGLFVYFGGKSINKKKAVSDALEAISVYSYFVKNDLKDFFKSQGIENIRIRTGIDLGHDNDVLWGNSGIGEISEVTTCSLHTSLASKMQSSADANGVVVGKHIVDELENQEYFSTVSSRTGSENDRYIYRIDEKNFYYTQFDFKWEKFLKNRSYIALDQMGTPVLKNPVILTSISKSSLEPIANKNRPYYSNE